jgi:hypothetical protein
MIKEKHIDHAELMQLGKMLLLLTERQRDTMDSSLVTEVSKNLAVVKGLPRAS